MFNIFKKKKREYSDEEIKQALAKSIEHQKIDEERRRVERESFLEGILKGVEKDFDEYEEGYRITSMKIPDIVYEPDTKTLSDITNKITEKYKCKFVSFSVNETSMAGKTYFFAFEKKKN